MNSKASQMYPAVVTGQGVARQVLCENADLMTVKFSFEKDAIGALHNHVHVQSTFVQSGSFRFTVADMEHILNAGDSLIIPSNVMHGCVALEAGILIDTFTPRRDDFL